jgi:hypothetical protein
MQVFSHCGDQIDDTSPIARDSEDPLENRMRGAELLIIRLKTLAIKDSVVDPRLLSYVLIELPGNCLARQQARLIDQNSSFTVESCYRKNDLLRSVFQLSLMSLFEEAEGKANTTGTEALSIVSMLQLSLFEIQGVRQRTIHTAMIRLTFLACPGPV